MKIRIREKYERVYRPEREIDVDEFSLDVRTKTLHIIKNHEYFIIDHVASIYVGKLL